MSIKAPQKHTADSADQYLEISALSRPLHLGTLYDARNDQLILGMRLWRGEDIKSKTSIKPKPDTSSVVSVSQTLSEKTSLLDVSASVKASLYSGLVELGGSAKYLKKKTSSARQCSVTLKYHVTTEFKELLISELGTPKPEVLDTADATHVVVGVLYGAHALMEFKDTAGDASSKQEILGNLKAMIDRIPKCNISVDGRLQLDDKDREKVKNMSCEFYGDVHLNDLPSTYEEAVKVYKKLPSLLGKKGENTVPVKVSLYPLSMFGNTESKLKNMISVKLVADIEKVMDAFHQAEIRTSDLLERSREIKTEDIVQKLERFRSSLRIFTVNFLRKMGDLIPAIRGGNMEENALGDLMKFQDASGFSGKDMKLWLDGKETEINVVTKNITKLKSEIRPPGPELDSFLMDPDVTDVFVFSFTSLSYEEPYLEKISQAAENFKSGSTTFSTPERNPGKEVDAPWYRRPEVKEALGSAREVFNKAPLKVISFTSDTRYPGASVRWYHNAHLKDPHVTTIPVHLHTREFTLDPNTVSRYLRLSEGNRKVTHAGEKQPYPDHPDRFTGNFFAGLITCPQVLSREPLPGRCYWEWEWSGRGVYVGVAYTSMGRREFIGYSAKAWCLYCCSDEYEAYHNSNRTVPPVTPADSRRVGVYVDREVGTLSFYRVSSDTLTHLHTFTTTFTSEPLHAAFYVYPDSSVSLI
ncbi:stonustoxin subunit beta-like [Sardina pilchardus]|uniref:stonustoxin subunit beta-like n=1 Tax=Sardina pilchardus TaxID=27697 RepID=UPI002E130D70